MVAWLYYNTSGKGVSNGPPDHCRVKVGEIHQLNMET